MSVRRKRPSEKEGKPRNSNNLHLLKSWTLFLFVLRMLRKARNSCVNVCMYKLSVCVNFVRVCKVVSCRTVKERERKRKIVSSWSSHSVHNKMIV